MRLTRLKIVGGLLVLVAVVFLAGDGTVSVVLRDKYAAEYDDGGGEVEVGVYRPFTPLTPVVRNSTLAAHVPASLRQSRALMDAQRLHLNYRKFSNSLSNVDEQRLILTRLDKCLNTTNMTDLFKRENMYKKAHTNAMSLQSGLRRVIPKFESSYITPCWKTEFTANLKSFRFLSLEGSIGDFNYSYDSRMSAHKLHEQTLIKGIQWSHTGREFRVEQSSVCLPKIFLLGYPKCGSTFLYCLLHRVLKHTIGTAGRSESAKEPHWWVVPGPRDRVQSLRPDYISLYLLNFNRAAQYRQVNIPTVPIDASPNLMFQWPRYSSTESLENYCLIPSLLPVVLPDSKFFVIMRNPISMLYSAFWFSCTTLGQKLQTVKFRGPDIFHDRITRKIDMFNECKNEGSPLDYCVDIVAPNLFTSELPRCGRTRLEMGLYYFHARKWLSVVPRSQIHFFTLEEVAKQDPRETVDIIIDFLDLPQPASQIYSEEDLQCNENSQNVIDYKNDPRLKMREDTRQILLDFFRPYNQMLADLLGDRKFLWKS